MAQQPLVRYSIGKILQAHGQVLGSVIMISWLMS